MTLTNSAPYSPGTVPSNTTRYLILLSDGLNTQNRWWATAVPRARPDDALIDGRLNSVCSAAKTDGVIIYSLYVHVNGGGNSTPLQNCATGQFQILRPDIGQPDRRRVSQTSPSRSPTCA